MILDDYPGLCESFLPQDPLSGAEHEAVPHAHLQCAVGPAVVPLPPPSCPRAAVGVGTAPAPAPM